MSRGEKKVKRGWRGGDGRDRGGRGTWVTSDARDIVNVFLLQTVCEFENEVDIELFRVPVLSELENGQETRRERG